MSTWTQRQVEAHMETETNQQIEGDDNTFFDVDKRYPWDDIKKWVIKTMCCKTRHGNTIVAFRTVVRVDKSTLPLWITVVNNMLKKTTKSGETYNMVAKDTR